MITKTIMSNKIRDLLKSRDLRYNFVFAKNRVTNFEYFFEYYCWPYGSVTRYIGLTISIIYTFNYPILYIRRESSYKYRQIENKQIDNSKNI